jgi:hypothetical protein
MKQIVEFICLKGISGRRQIRVGRRAYLIPLIHDEHGIIQPKPIHMTAVTDYYTRDHFETIDRIYIHYTGTEDPFINYIPSPLVSTIKQGECTLYDLQKAYSRKPTTLLNLGKDYKDRINHLLSTIPTYDSEFLEQLSKLQNKSS